MLYFLCVPICNGDNNPLYSLSNRDWKPSAGWYSIMNINFTLACFVQRSNFPIPSHCSYFFVWIIIMLTALPVFSLILMRWDNENFIPVQRVRRVAVGCAAWWKESLSMLSTYLILAKIRLVKLNDGRWWLGDLVSRDFSARSFWLDASTVPVQFYRRCGVGGLKMPVTIWISRTSSYCSRQCCGSAQVKAFFPG